MPKSRKIRESDYFTESGEYSVGVHASKTMLDSIMYKMSYYRFGELRVGFDQQNSHFTILIN